VARPVDPQITAFIIEKLERHPDDIGQLVVQQFDVTRQTAVNYLSRLIRAGLVEGTGTTSARRYYLRKLAATERVVDVRPDMADDEPWERDIFPILDGVAPKEVIAICRYAATEMFNNVIDHSESETCTIWCERDAAKITITIWDRGIGIFRKIQDAFNLTDPRHALLELTKGKLTTDARRHSGEGIFFSSRAMDNFVIASDKLFYMKRRSHDGWLIEDEESDELVVGTMIKMVIGLDAKQTLREVFDQFSTGDDYGFGKTHVPIKLAKYEGETLVSRSQAKRIMARVDVFSEVILDFSDIDDVGQAFADEIFRVFAREHPEVRLYPINTTPRVDEMIRRARTNPT
jgi:anti-sigma regulatory factor (Ser/Thr protein kinase)